MAHVSRTAAGLILAACSLLGAAGFSSVALAAGEPPAGKPKADAPTQDTLIFKDGRTVSGTIVSETETIVRIKGVIKNMAFETEYDKTMILSITRAAKPANGASGASAKAVEPGAASPSTPARPPVDSLDDDAKVRVYSVELTGEFGEDISQTPIRQAFKDARSNNADYIIVTINNNWNMNAFQDLPNDAGAFDQIFRGNDMQEVFNTELKAWDKPPKLVFWVKQAMGGAAILPLLSETIFFAPDARMGGIGNLSEILKGVDEVVRQKQISLRISQAEGLAIIGKHDPRIVLAMAKSEFELSYTFENGKVKFLERMPEGPNEYLLTDDGLGDNKDDIKALARGEGNDVLTLTPDIAQKIGVSQGTVDNMDALLFDLGISRNAVRVDGRSKYIMEGWKKSIEQSKKRMRELVREFGEIQVSGATYAERTRQRGQQKSKLLDILSIYKQKGEGISRQWLGQNRIPSESDIQTILVQIDLQQAQDK